MQGVHGKAGVEIHGSISSRQVFLTTELSYLGWRKADAFEIYQRSRTDRIWQLTGCRGERKWDISVLLMRLGTHEDLKLETRKKVGGTLILGLRWEVK